jgi:cytochrome P450
VTRRRGLDGPAARGESGAVVQNPLARSIRTRDGLPVLPGAFPLVGHLPAFYRRLPEVMRRARADLGPIFWITLGPGMWVALCTGLEALEIFRSKAFDSSHLPTVSPLVAGASVLAQDGRAHRHLRSALNGPFLPRGLAAGRVGPMMARALGDLCAGWCARGEARIVPAIQDTALAIIFRMIGVDPGDLPAWRAQYRDLLLANLGTTLMFPGSPAYRAARARRWIDARMSAVVAAARAAPDPGSLLGALVRATDDEGAALTDVELLDNLRLLVLGGHETISSTMAWMVIMLAARPDLWDALLAEVGGEAEVPLTPEAARSFPFAEALFRETVRMYPPFGAITRTAIAPFVLHGRTLPRGALVGVDLWGIAHDPELFPDPDDFRPARWLGRSSPPTPLEISQFGAGPHFCLGYHLAWLEAVQLAVALAREARRARRRPALRGGRVPQPIFLPTEHPPARTRVDFVPG